MLGCRCVCAGGRCGGAGHRAVPGQFITLSVHHCVQHEAREAAHRAGPSATADTGVCVQAGAGAAVQGTVPYLGTFLTDLMMVDAAFRDTSDTGLINFDKRRREFELLTQIKLFQSAASMYRIVPDHRFADWLNRLQTLDDNDRSATAAAVLVFRLERLPSIDDRDQTLTNSLFNR